MKAESQDRFFTEYLMKLESRLIQEKHQLDLMETELDRNCQIYRQRVSAPRPEPVKSEPIQAENRSVQFLPQQGPQQGPPQAFPQGAFSAGTVLPQTSFAPFYQQPQAEPQRQKNHEFTIGINVFGTIGVLFVLAALILLGINYVGSLVWELGLYALGLLVWGVAEFVVKKRNRTIAMIFSSLGISSLYVTTMVNFLYLHNFNALAAILITTAITVAVMFVSRREDAGILRIICIGACLVSFLSMDTLHMASDMELLIYMVMILIVQLLGIFLPVKKWGYGIAIGQMAGAAAFAWLFAISTIPPRK